MHRIVLFVFAWLILAISVATAVPARPRYEPADANAPLVDLRNTTWVGFLYVQGEQVTFHPEGTLTYGHAGNTSPGNWRLTGNQLWFQVNQWSEYQTTVVGDVIQGTGTNKNGQKTIPLLKRVSPYKKLLEKQQEKAQW